MTAGGLLKEARQAAGMHIAALAVALKVPVSKLEALEADNYAVLPDTVFVRALASSVCRTLKIDAAPILLLLPQSQSPRLSVDSAGINAPVKGSAGKSSASSSASFAGSGSGSRSMVLVVLALLLGAVVLFSAFTQDRKGGDPIGRIPWRALLCIVGAILFFGFFLPRLGFLICFPVMIVMTASGSSEFTWRDALLNAAILTGMSYFIFIYALQLTIPLWPAL